jgi:beta-lactamase regulating signal transducer with metallopeptidase domain
MNETGILLFWCAVQATLYLLVGVFVYLVVRRFGPATGAWAAACTLMMLCCVTVAVFSPWPRWWSPPANDALPVAQETVPTAPTANVEDDGAPAALTGDRPAKPRPAAGVTVKEYWRLFQAELKTAGTSATATATPRRLPTMVAVILIAGSALAVVRILIGVAALRRYRRRLSSIDDPRLRELADELARSLGCHAPTELKQSPSLLTPATMGWRRPVIVLPGDWRSWSDVERRVVLAHELAHIARGDYLTWLLAQMAVALHVYHPLVHWLAGRLRLEQELAADACAADVAGGRENYLLTLAQMALRQDDRRVAWAARPFLPTRGTLLRRIEMLSETKRLTNRPVSRRRAVALAGVAGLTALVISGVRAPTGDTPLAQAAPPAVQTPTAPAAESKAIDLSFVPSSALAVVAVRPSELLSKNDMQPLAKLLNEAIGLEKKTGLKVEKIEEVKLAITRMPSPDTRGPEGVTLHIVRYAEAFDWKAKFAENLLGKTVEASVAGKTYYHSDHGDQAIRPAFYLPDDRSIVFGPEIDLQRAILSVGRSKPEWAADWEESATGVAAAMVDVAALGRAVNEALRQHPQPQVAAFAPLWEQGQRLFVSAQADQGLSVAARVQCGSDDGAQRVRDTVQAVLTLARNALDEADRQAAKATAAQAAAMVPMIDLAREVLKQGKMTIDGHEVQYASALDLDAAETAVSVLMPAIVAAREAARQSQAANNLKQIMLAFHNYYDVNGHFPPPVVIGPDGKTPHSWRVEILPYIEQQALFTAYKMDEPWDSDNNKKVLAQMPVVLCDPQADHTKFETSYFALVGPTTALGSKDGKGTKFQEITDGTSNTIAIVEAKRAVPWTKPEDIDYDPAKPLPRFGGWHTGGFWAAFCDGHVSFLNETNVAQQLPALISKAGGEPIINPN